MYGIIVRYQTGEEVVHRVPSEERDPRQVMLDMYVEYMRYPIVKDVTAFQYVPVQIRAGDFQSGSYSWSDLNPTE